MQVKNKVAVVTGAGSGIGQVLAQTLARRGCQLALADVNASSLHTTAELLAGYKVKVSQHVLDVADRAAVAALPTAVLEAHGHVDMLVNNAGVALSGTFEQTSEADFDWLMDINFHGLVRMTRAFLPLLRQRPQARIVNVSSLFGLISPPGQSAYSASKFAVRGFSNALRLELEKTKVGVTVAHPGGIATAIATSARVSDKMGAEEAARHQALAQKMLRMPPDRAAEIIVRAVERGQARVLVGMDAKILALLERLMPVHYWRLLARGANK